MKPKFRKDRSEFVADLKKEVSVYFDGKDRKGIPILYAKTIILCSSLIVLYILALWSGAMIVFGLLGIVVALIGFNVMHDASHGSYSNNTLLNKILTFVAADIMGGSSRFWDEKHNHRHHTHTNIVAVDDDIGKSPLFRLAPSHVHKWFHRYQYVYCWFIYCLTTIYWFYINDFVVYVTKKIGDESLQMTRRDHFLFWIGKAIHITVFVILPFAVLGLSWWTFWCLILMHACASLFLAIVFQMAHVVETTKFYELEDELDSWHIHEILTTANFATKSRIWKHLLGGLNFQVEHHLFRDVSHSHYPALNRIVKRLCVRHNIPYNEFPSFRLAIVSHTRYLKTMGKSN